jgi:hypothetical protein
MVTAGTTVWLQPGAAVEAAAGCGPCQPDEQPHPGACAARRAPPCLSPALAGDPDRLAHVLQALRSVADADGNLVDAHRFSALRVGADEVELTLAFPRSCGPSRVLADAAFHVLRHSLPDTDVYVLFAG